MARRVGPSQYVVGDRVRLVKPFRCDGDPIATDVDIQDTLRHHYGGAEIVGMVDEVNSGWLHVMFDPPEPGSHGLGYYVDDDVLEPEIKPVSDEEEAEAIRSILGE